MPRVSELMSGNIANTMTNVQTWGGIIYNVKAYGAKGDDKTDDYESIQKTIEAAYKAGGGDVFIPAGIYLISSKLMARPNVRLIGNGYESIIKASPSLTGYVIDSTGDIDNAAFESFTIVGDATNNLRSIAGIRINSGRNVTIRSMNILDMNGYNPIQVFSAEQCKVLDCYIDGNLNGDGIAFGSSCTYSIIQGCTVRNVSDTSIVIADRSHYSSIIGCTCERGTNGQGNGIAVTASRGFVVSGNTIDGYPPAGRGIVTYNDPNSGYAAEQGLIIGNTVLNGPGGTSGAIHAINGRTTITGNLIKDCSQGIRAGGDDVVILSNHITHTTGGDQAILLENAVDAVVMNNVIDGIFSYGLRFLPGCTGGLAMANVVRGATLQNYADIPGTNKQALNYFATTLSSGQVDSFNNIIQATNAYLRLGRQVPTSPVKGDMYFDNAANNIKVYDGTAWRTLNWM